MVQPICPRCGESKYVFRHKKGKSAVTLICRNCQKKFTIKHKELDYDPSLIPMSKDVPRPDKQWQPPRVLTDEAISRKVENDIEKLKKEKEQLLSSSPIVEEHGVAPLQPPAPHSSPFKKDAGGIWSAFVVITVAIAVVTTGNLWALMALGFLIFQVEAFSSALITVGNSIAGVFIGIASVLKKQGQIREIAGERRELELRKFELDRKEQGLSDEIKSFSEIREKARAEIEKLVVELRADDIRAMYQQEFNRRNTFEKELMNEFTTVMQTLSPLMKDIASAKEKVEREV